MLPEIVIKFLAERLRCRTNDLILLEGIDVVLDVLDGGALVFLLLIQMSLSIMSTSVHQRLTT